MSLVQVSGINQCEKLLVNVTETGEGLYGQARGLKGHTAPFSPNLRWKKINHCTTNSKPSLEMTSPWSSAGELTQFWEQGLMSLVFRVGSASTDHGFGHQNKKLYSGRKGTQGLFFSPLCGLIILPPPQPFPSVGSNMC